MLPSRDREGAVQEYRLRIIAALVLVFCLSGPGFAVQHKKRPTHTAQKKKGRRRAAPKSLAQMAPTPERYLEIQQAMVAKGYGPQAPNGVWSPEWASALKRYQQDQKLEPTGKLNSLSLITLGLGGAKREPPAGVTAPPARPADQPSSSSSTVREPK
jgi:peptidoglycan hydrolase-like protein with peptidoglycan-binding domain